MFREWGEGQPEIFFSGISDFATVKVAEDGEEQGLPAWANEEGEWEVPCELLLPLAHPLSRAVRNIFWDKGDLGDVRVPAHQHAEEVYQGGERLRPRESSPDNIAHYEERLRYFEGDHVFVGGEGVEGAEEEEGEEAEEEEGVEAEEEEVEETEEEEGGEAEDEEGLDWIGGCRCLPVRPVPFRTTHFKAFVPAPYHTVPQAHLRISALFCTLLHPSLESNATHRQNTAAHF